MMIDRETKIVKLSILVLCFALIFVYVVWFYVKGGQVDMQQSETTSAVHTGAGDIPSTSSSPSNPTSASESDELTGDVVTSVPEIAPGNPDPTPVGGEDGFTPPTVDEKIILSGTQLLEQGAEFADLLGIHYKYALIGSNGVEYLYLGQGLNNDFTEILHQYNGTIYAIDTEYEIKKNALWGERVLYLNFPSYEKKLVFMVVKVKSGYWLIKIDYNQYYQLKPYLKSLFTE